MRYHSLVNQGSGLFTSRPELMLEPVQEAVSPAGFQNPLEGLLNTDGRAPPPKFLTQEVWGGV